MNKEISKMILNQYFLDYEKKISFLSDKYFANSNSVINLYCFNFQPTLIHFLTWKSNFSQHLFNIKRENSLLYNSCGFQNGNPIHVIFTCTSVNNARMNLKSQLFRSSVMWPPSKKSLLKYLSILFRKPATQ